MAPMVQARTIVEIAAGDERFSTLVAAVTAAGIPEGSNCFRPLPASQRLCITAGAGGVTIADGAAAVAYVVVADIIADNGVIHVIDKVLLPGTRPACH